MKKYPAREVAMKMLFAHALGGDESLGTILEQAGEDGEAPLTEKDKAIAEALVNGVLTEADNLDAVIGEFSQGWALDRIGKVELCILRIAVYEMLHIPEIPVGASIDEAVELAKRYGDDRSPSFINGILGAVARKYCA